MATAKFFIPNALRCWISSYAIIIANCGYHWKNTLNLSALCRFYCSVLRNKRKNCIRWKNAFSKCKTNLGIFRKASSKTIAILSKLSMISPN